MARVSKGSKSERFGFVHRHGLELGFRYLCDWLEVSPSGYYKWRDRKESKHSKDDKLLLKKITQLFNDSGEAYGSPRVFEGLKKQGICVGRKRVERIMRETGLVGRSARVYRKQYIRDKMSKKFPNLRVSRPRPTGINKQWVADITYIKVNGRWHYLSVVMDLYSRRIIGWSLGENRIAELTLESLQQAFQYRDVRPGLIFHTDRGAEYGASLIQDELKRHDALPSMNRQKSMTDNAHMESFFHSIKGEKLQGVEYKTKSDLRIALSDYIDCFYNDKRMHSSLGYESPMEYERMAA